MTAGRRMAVADSPSVAEHGVERMVVVARKGRQYAPERSADEVLEHEDLVEPQRCVERDET
jgi:hypothetical protein